VTGRTPRDKDPLYTSLLADAGIAMDEFGLGPADAADRTLAKMDRILASYAPDDERRAQLRTALISELAVHEYPCPADLGPTLHCAQTAGHDGPHKPIRDKSVDQTRSPGVMVLAGVCVLAGIAASGAIAGLLLGQNGGEWWPWPALYLFILATPVAIGASYAFMVLLAVVSNVVAVPAQGVRSLTRHRGKP
jgi:hypothetical protein